MPLARPALLALVLGTAPALADPTMECAGASQIEIGACMRDTLSAVDAAVEAALGFARQTASELDRVTGRNGTLAALEASQTAWEMYREAQCAFVGAGFGGGSGTGIGIAACRITLGRTRVDELLRAAN